MMKLKQTFISPRLTALLLLVLILGVGLQFDLMARPESFPVGVPVIRQARPTNLSERAPANIGTQEFHISTWSEADKILTIEWDCQTIKKQKKLINVTQLRLNGSCLRDIKKITNKNNGYTANLFALEKSFTTDFLSLEVGANILNIEWVDGASANRVTSLEITVEKQ
jgi:hypothetical protein